ncbi:hypothetical protein [Spirillospora sp. CA-294931]|uniref:hypothetical protein n=1 Tax=Spirillospora sp. CA-294931 TaxID=3240042 RepID=UPI003D8C76EE
MNGIVAAFAATGLYYVGFAIFKLAADRMEPVRANRLPHMVWVILTNWIFLAGLALVLGGLGLQILALTKLSLGIAVPIFMSGVLPLLVIAMIFFGDRLTPREWLSLALIGTAVGLLTLSVGRPPPIEAVDVPTWKMAVVVVPAIVVPLLINMFGDHRPDGRHARPVTGIAYGLSSGFPVGTAELAIKGWSDSSSQGLGVLSTPYPYVTVAAAALGFGIMVAGFQRCRVSIVAAVMTVAAKSYLLVMGAFMYAEPWPSDTSHFAMRMGALALAALAVAQFPRHRPLGEGPVPAPEAVPPVQDVFGSRIPRPRAPLAPLAEPPLAAPHPPPQTPTPTPYRGDPLGRGPYGHYDSGNPTENDQR